jgi:CHAD domain-containing protein
MSFQLTYHEAFSEGVKRLIIQECKTVCVVIQDAESEDDEHKAIHQARKSFKKIRAALKLVKHNFNHYDNENKWFRDRGREISQLRDATANLKVLEELSTRFKSSSQESIFGTLAQELRANRDKLRDTKLKQEKLLQRLESNLDEKIKSVSGWKVNAETFEDIQPNIKRSYTKGQHELKEVLHNTKPKHIHEFRKKAKSLRYQLDLLNRLWPAMMDTTEDEFHKLTKYTGTMNDLNNLKQAISSLDTFIPRKELDTVELMIENWREYLREQVVLLGPRLYAETPKVFCNRLAVYWMVHHEQISNS